MKPTKQQEPIINYDGSAVVIAAPGSGKTFVLSQKIKRNLKGLLDHEGVIAISYTNKASNELKSRSLSQGENPKSSFFGTIDRFYLAEIIIPFGKHLFGIPKNHIQIKKIDFTADDNPFSWFNRSLKLADINEQHLQVIEEHFLDGIIMIDTIGILADFVFSNSLACRNYIKSRYKYIYIDEYQDSGYEQHEIFLKIKKLGIDAVAVGDLNQSIYAFSFKDAKYLEELTANAEFKLFKLDKNHRCHPSIINYSNFLLNPKTELLPTNQNLVFFNRVDGDEKAVAKHIDKLIIKIQKAFKITNLNQIGILTKVKRTGEILNSEMQTPRRLSVDNDLDINLNIWSAIFSNLLHYFFDPKFKFIEVVEVFTTYEKFKKSELAEFAKIKKNLEALSASEELDVKALAIQFVATAKLIAPNLANKESVALLTSVLNNPLELKSYEPAGLHEVNILTLHKSKGLEFDVVINVDLVKWVFPQMSPGPNNDFNNPIYTNKQQDLNLHYVGITRARKGCFLLSSTKRTNFENKIKNGDDSEFLWKDGIENLRYKFSESAEAE